MIARVSSGLAESPRQRRHAGGVGGSRPVDHASIAASSTTFSLPGAIESRSTTNTTMRPSSALLFVTGPDTGDSARA